MTPNNTTCSDQGIYVDFERNLIDMQDQQDIVIDKRFRLTFAILAVVSLLVALDGSSISVALPVSDASDLARENGETSYRSYYFRLLQRS